MSLLRRKAPGLEKAFSNTIYIYDLHIYMICLYTGPAIYLIIYVIYNMFTYILNIGF